MQIFCRTQLVANLLVARRVRGLSLIHAPPTGSRRYSRLAACATGRPAC